MVNLSQYFNEIFFVWALRIAYCQCDHQGLFACSIQKLSFYQPVELFVAGYCAFDSSNIDGYFLLFQVYPTLRSGQILPSVCWREIRALCGRYFTSSDVTPNSDAFAIVSKAVGIQSVIYSHFSSSRRNVLAKLLFGG